MANFDITSERYSHVPGWIIFIAGMLSTLILLLGGIAIGWVSVEFNMGNENGSNEEQNLEENGTAGTTGTEEGEDEEMEVYILEDEPVEI